MMHDYWMALVAFAMGKTGTVQEPTLGYRQHATNAVGAGKLLTVRERLRRIVEDPQLSYWLKEAALQATTFLERYREHLTPRQRLQLETMPLLADRRNLEGALYSLRRGIVRTEFLNEVQFLLRLMFGERQR